jgi:hypothetical protein
VIVCRVVAHVRRAKGSIPAGASSAPAVGAQQLGNGSTSSTIPYNYDTAKGLNDVISRLDNIAQGTTTFESYKYLGLDTVVKKPRIPLPPA